ncbi:MAG: bifunctional chorismate mutase/prephenate dehydratase [Lachnospiraceae bacterium]|nr:bifunctional chorismate mutase/prephenate dehydratase [Lachnospiraceae bacterium]
MNENIQTEGEQLKIAYSGIVGAFAHNAAVKIFPGAKYVAKRSFAEVYSSVSKGECAYGVLPIENSYAGEVGQSIDLMFKGNLKVSGLYYLPITQNLLGVKGAVKEDIKTVVSHSMALEQCLEYIEQHGFARQEESNTAVAARKVAGMNDRSVAAIASIETADLYGLTVLEKEINKSEQNTTKFAVISRDGVEIPKSPLLRCKNAGTDGIIMMMFTVDNVAGALVKAIEVVGRYGYNMRTLRSRPMHNLPFEYYFYVEATGDILDGNPEKMQEEMGKWCTDVKILAKLHKEEEI